MNKVNRKQVIEYLNKRLELLERKRKKLDKHGLSWVGGTKEKYISYVIGMLKDKEI